MHTREIQIFQLAQTALNDEQVRAWLDSIGATEFQLPEGVTDPATLVGLAAKRCYMAFQEGLNPNITKVRKKWHKYLENILKQAHGSVFEHATYTFAIENITRVFTGEMNRHRAGVAISEGSMRYIRFDDISYWEPHSILPGSLLLCPQCPICKGTGAIRREEPDEVISADKVPCPTCNGTGREGADIEFEERKWKTRAIFADTFQTIEDTYKRLIELWEIDDGNFDSKKKLTSLFRRIIPMGVCTGGVWTYNIRALRHVIGMRSHPAAEEEICYVATTIAKMMIEDLEPMMFGDLELDSVTNCWVPKFWKV
jgi:thymidylate synthase (FAD)